ncbi:MAG: FAD-dependent oxidoreductase, partial [Halobacteriales archaeon]|nr:FAD-dependent oxidoreductase [Halobacteriales archaeon]
MVADRFEVAVIGAGVTGMACAHELARDHDVVVLDRGSVGGDTTSKASGVITTPSVFPTTPEVGALAMRFFRAFSGTGTYRFHHRPKVQPVSPESAQRARMLGERSGRTFIERDAVEDRYPGVFKNLGDAVGLLEYADAGVLDPVDYTHSLKHAARELGADVRTGVEVLGLETRNDGVTGVETEFGSIKAETVVAAAGWRTRELLADHVAIPTRPFRWNAIVLDPDPPIPSDFPIGAVDHLRLYWRPTPEGRLLVGGNEHVVSDPVNTPPKIQESFRQTVRDDLGNLLAGITDARVVREDCCPTADTATPDTWPIIDAPADAPDGLVVATGFHGRGVMTSPVTAEA